LILKRVIFNNPVGQRAIFFLNIALFISISETSIDLQEFSEVGQRPSRWTRQRQVASSGCD
jgi:hypothetical protein